MLLFFVSVLAQCNSKLHMWEWIIYVWSSKFWKTERLLLHFLRGLSKFQPLNTNIFCASQSVIMYSLFICRNAHFIAVHAMQHSWFSKYSEQWIRQHAKVTPSWNLCLFTTKKDEVLVNRGETKDKEFLHSFWCSCQAIGFESDTIPLKCQTVSERMRPSSRIVNIMLAKLKSGCAGWHIRRRLSPFPWPWANTTQRL